MVNFKGVQKSPGTTPKNFTDFFFTTFSFIKEDFRPGELQKGKLIFFRTSIIYMVFQKCYENFFSFCCSPDPKVFFYERKGC